ncbi:iron export ABC transporter permease subunit FetB [bacterium]|nr:iron export ABC transporter permease subunit FetB [bacterium]
MNYIDLTYIDLAIAISLLALAAIVLWRERLGLVRDFLWGSIRAFVQLSLVGLALKWIFAADHPLPVAGFLLLIIAAATLTAGRRQKRRLPHSFLLLAGAIASGVVPVLAIGVLLVVRPQPFWQGQYLLPLAGMTTAGAMNAANLTLNRLAGEMKSRQHEIEAVLALGLSPQTAVRDLTRDVAQAALIPTINALLAMGIVQLPGMMSGQILAGVPPVAAVKYQIVILFMISSAAVLTTVLTLRWATHLYFTKREQLRYELVA